MRSTFVVNLPSKYLQHFPIRRWADKRIDFEGGVYAANEDGNMKIGRNGKLWNSCRYPGTNCPPTDCVLFMPWDPIQETKIYHWNDAGGTTSWQLPESWQGLKEVLLYELTPLGRVRVCSLPVRNGQVTVDARPRTPYVLYKEPAPPLPEVVWGEGSLVKDPGFDSASFNWWKPFAASREVSHVGVARDSKGQAHLRIKGNNGAAGGVTQRIYGLEGGQTVLGLRLGGAEREADGQPDGAACDRQRAPLCGDGSPGMEDRACGQRREGRQGRAGCLAAGWGQVHDLAHGVPEPPPWLPARGGGGHGQERASSGFYYTPRANRGNGTIENFEFYVSRDASDWGKAVVAGSFLEHDDGGETFEVLFEEPVTARYFKLVAT